jgi:hypothetical protein
VERRCTHQLHWDLRHPRWPVMTIRKRSLNRLDVVTDKWLTIFVFRHRFFERDDRNSIYCYCKTVVTCTANDCYCLSLYWSNLDE